MDSKKAASYMKPPQLRNNQKHFLIPVAITHGYL